MRRRILHVVLALGFVAVGVVALKAFVATRPEIEKSEPTVPLPMVVVIETEVSPQTVTVRGEGTVRPLRQISLVPQVSGKVVSVCSHWGDGAAFSEGDVLIQIEPIDYELAVTLARARVRDAESALMQLQEEAAVSLEEWQQHPALRGQAKARPPALVAREPQLAAAQAALEASRADLKRAELNLERTVIRAPFDGRVATEQVDRGQYVSPGQSLATLYSTDAAEIVLPLDERDLRWFHVPGFTEGQGPGAEAEVRARIADRDLRWTGRVIRSSEVDPRTRMVHVVVRVDAPYATRPPLASGLFVTVDIQGRTLPGAAIIPRSALQGQDQVWIAGPNDTVAFRQVEVARVLGETVLIKEGIRSGERLIVSRLKAVTPGMKVRVASERKQLQ